MVLYILLAGCNSKSQYALQVKMYIKTMTTLIFVTVYVTLIAQEIAADGPNIISREEWRAREPKFEVRDLRLKPVNYVVIHHSEGYYGCETQPACQLKIRNIQNDHMNSSNKNFSDIGYNFLVGEDGNVYEGRGWDKQGAHSQPLNDNSISICFIGNFTDRRPNTAAVQAATNLIAQGVENNKIKINYKLLGHRQTQPGRKCPGDSLYEMIKSWPNWSETD